MGPDVEPIAPIHFFCLRASCHQLAKGRFPRIDQTNFHRYLLPDRSSLFGTAAFAEVAAGWSDEGLEFFVAANCPFERALFPEIGRGDSFEVMVDTRDVKSSGYNTRFCHHFFFLPSQADGKQAGELTHFRTEDSHSLCDADLLSVQADLLKNRYTLSCFLPREVLVGFDPDQFDRLGLSYRVNRFGGKPQHFSASSELFLFEQQPSLWASVRLIE